MSEAPTPPAPTATTAPKRRTFGTCVDCGQPVYRHGAQRCRTCFLKQPHAGRFTPNTAQAAAQAAAAARRANRAELHRLAQLARAAGLDRQDTPDHAP